MLKTWDSDPSPLVQKCRTCHFVGRLSDVEFAKGLLNKGQDQVCQDLTVKTTLQSGTKQHLASKNKRRDSIELLSLGSKHDNPGVSTFFVTARCRVPVAGGQPRRQKKRLYTCTPKRLYACIPILSKEAQANHRVKFNTKRKYVESNPKATPNQP